MAQVVTVKFGDVMLQVGDGADPEVFDDICGITSYTHDYNISTQSEDLPDCTDADAAGYESPVKISVGESVGVQGFVSPESHELMRELVYETEPRNLRLVFNKGALKGHLSGPGIVTAAQGGNWERRRSGTFTGTFTFTAKPVWTATP